MTRWLLLVGLTGVVAACGTRFEIKNYAGSTDRLYAASLNQYKHHHWDEAVQGFERLTLDLPAHDTLLPTAYFYLGNAHRHNSEPLLAAQAFARLAEGFPDDTLASTALFESGKAYSSMWHRPDLDAQYGQQALSEYQQLVALYPSSPLKDPAEREISRLQEWFAMKDFLTGLHYYRLKAYDSAIIYFKAVVKNYPETPASRRAYLRLVDTYRAIRYKDDEQDACTQLRTSYPNDPEVKAKCGGVPVSTEARGP